MAAVETSDTVKLQMVRKVMASYHTGSLTPEAALIKISSVLMLC